MIPEINHSLEHATDKFKDNRYDLLNIQKKNKYIYH